MVCLCFISLLGANDLAEQKSPGAFFREVYTAPAAFPAGVDPNRGSEETVRSPGETVRSPGVL